MNVCYFVFLNYWSENFLRVIFFYFVGYVWLRCFLDLKRIMLNVCFYWYVNSCFCFFFGLKWVEFELWFKKVNLRWCLEMLKNFKKLN